VGGNPFLGMVILVPYPFAPYNWQFCAGQLVSIAENSALFNLLGTTFGGDGQNTFGLPDLQGRTPLHAGTDQGGIVYVQGQRAGTEAVSLTGNQNALHSHQVAASNTGQTTTNPNNNYLAAGPAAYQSGSVPTAGKSLYPSSISVAGSSNPHSNLQPYLVMNWIISMAGIYPSQN
jgi:microcystin-dependent protein